MADAQQTFAEMTDALAGFAKALQKNQAKIKPAIAPLEKVGVPIKDLINALDKLLKELITKAQALKLDQLDPIPEFTRQVAALLKAWDIDIPANVGKAIDLIGGFDDMRDQLVAAIEGARTALAPLAA